MVSTLDEEIKTGIQGCALAQELAEVGHLSGTLDLLLPH